MMTFFLSLNSAQWKDSHLDKLPSQHKAFAILLIVLSLGQHNFEFELIYMSRFCGMAWNER